MRTAHAAAIAISALLLAMGDVGSAVSQEKAQARLNDGSNINVTLPADFLTVTTRYGKLAIPFSEVRRVDFGLHIPADVEEKVKAAVRDLSSAAFKDREAAVKALIAHGMHAYPAVLAATKNADIEASKRAEAVVRRIEALHARLVTKEEDTIHTDGWPIVGRIQDTEIKATSQTFGALTIKVSDLKSLIVMAPDADSEIGVDAAKDWTETRISLDGMATLHLSATGQVDLWPIGPGQYMTTPKGYTAAGKGGSFMAGTLIGKIGTGSPFIVGESYMGKPGEGRLFLYVVPSPWNNPSAGEYKVKVRLEYR